MVKNMNTGTKIRKLRENKRMSQDELASQLGISQTTLHNIETDKSRKIDSALIFKMCDIFDKDPLYFADDSVINNNVQENKGQISCENFTVNNFPESILAEIQNLINENKALRAKIAEMGAG
jgi:transcriptional regulator with XRE-family HTH domain